MFSRLTGAGELLSQPLAILSSPFPLGDVLFTGNVLSTPKVPRDACSMSLGGHGKGRPLLFHGAVGWFVGDSKAWVDCTGQVPLSNQ